MIVISFENIFLYSFLGLLLSILLYYSEKHHKIYTCLNFILKIYSIVFLLFLILYIVSPSFPTYYNYIDGITKTYDINEAVLIREGYNYYILQPDGRKEFITKIEIKDNHIDYLRNEEDDTVCLVDMAFDKKSIITIRFKVNILYVSDELFNILNSDNPPIVVDLGDYIQ